MSAFERVEVVEANRKGASEALCDLVTEHALALLCHEELEPDLERGLEPEQDPALGGDQLVRPREVRRVGLDAERPSKPLTAPGAREEARARPERATGEIVERRAERLPVERARPRGVAHVDEPVEGREEIRLVPVVERPVDEDEPLLARGQAFRLSQVARGAASDRGERHALRDVGVPEEVVRDEPRAGAEDDRHPAVLGTGRQPVEQVSQRAVRESGEDRVAGKVGGSRPSEDLVPGDERPADVERLGVERLRERGDKARPIEPRRPVERHDARAVPRDLRGQRRDPDLDLAPGDRVAGLSVVRHAGGLA